MAVDNQAIADSIYGGAVSAFYSYPVSAILDLAEASVEFEDQPSVSGDSGLAGHEMAVPVATDDLVFGLEPPRRLRQRQLDSGRVEMAGGFLAYA